MVCQNRQGSICETRKSPNRPPIRRGIDYLVNATAFGHFRPTSGGRKCQKAHLHTKTFHLNLCTCLYDNSLQRYSLEKLMFRKTADLGFGHKFRSYSTIFRDWIWPKLPKGTSTRQNLSFAPTPMSIQPSVTKKQSGKSHVSVWKTRYFWIFWPNLAKKVKRCIYTQRPFI